MSMLGACRPLEDLRVSITGGVHFDLVKRVLRDINRSGQAPEEIIQQVKVYCVSFRVGMHSRTPAGNVHSRTACRPQASVSKILHYYTHMCMYTTTRVCTHVCIGVYSSRPYHVSKSVISTGCV